MSEIINSSQKRSKVKIKKGFNKHSTRVDLTPMVDLGFLLITFFVFTTNLNKTNSMKIMMPKDGAPHLVKHSGTMTIILGNDHKIFYYYGKLIDQNAFAQIKSTDTKNIRELIVQKKKVTIPKDLMYIIKADKKSRYKDIIGIYDEMTICDIPQGHFAEVDLTNDEALLINKNGSQ